MINFLNNKWLQLVAHIKNMRVRDGFFYLMLMVGIIIIIIIARSCSLKVTSRFTVNVGNKDVHTYKLEDHMDIIDVDSLLKNKDLSGVDTMNIDDLVLTSIDSTRDYNGRLLATIEQQAYIKDYLSNNYSIHVNLKNDNIKNKTTHYFIHCTASTYGKRHGIDYWLSFFEEQRGWSRVGYSVMIPIGGGRDTLRPYILDGYTSLEEFTYGVSGYNLFSMHIALEGGIDRFGNASNTYDLEQIKELSKIIREILCVDPCANIIGHRDISPDLNGNGVVDDNEFIKMCPSIDTRDFFNLK